MMRRLGLIGAAVTLAGAAFLAGTFTAPRETVAADRPDIKIGQRTGYFNMPRVMKDYRRAQVSVERLAARRDRMAANLLGLRAMYLQLQPIAQATKDPQEQHRIAGQMIALMRMIEDMDRELNKAVNDKASGVIADLYRELRETVAELAKDRGLVAVHGYPGNPATENPQEMELMLKPPAAHPFYLDASVDYTGELIRRLNDKFDAEAGGQ